MNNQYINDPSWILGRESALGNFNSNWNTLQEMRDSPELYGMFESTVAPGLQQVKSPISQSNDWQTIGIGSRQPNGTYVSHGNFDASGYAEYISKEQMQNLANGTFDLDQLRNDIDSNNANFLNGLPILDRPPFYTDGGPVRNFMDLFDQGVRRMGGYGNLYLNYMAADEGLNNQQNWDSAFAQIENIDITDTDGYGDAIAALSRRGLSGSDFMKNELANFKKQGTSDLSTSLSDYYTSLRNEDYLNYIAEFQPESALIAGGSHLSDIDDQFNWQNVRTDAAALESENFGQVMDYVNNNLLGDVFSNLIARLNKTPAPDAVQGTGGGLTAYTGDLASPSQIKQPAPTQEFQSIFPNDVNKTYRGS